MKTFGISYVIHGSNFTVYVVARNFRTAKYKLSMKHKCDVKAIKVIEYKEI